MVVAAVVFSFGIRLYFGFCVVDNIDDVNSLWLFTKHLEWVPQNI
jgi:hypothetical protein